MRLKHIPDAEYIPRCLSRQPQTVVFQLVGLDLLLAGEHALFSIPTSALLLYALRSGNLTCTMGVQGCPLHCLTRSTNGTLKIP